MSKESRRTSSQIQGHYGSWTFYSAANFYNEDQHTGKQTRHCEPVFVNLLGERQVLEFTLNSAELFWFMLGFFLLPASINLKRLCTLVMLNLFLKQVVWRNHRGHGETKLRLLQLFLCVPWRSCIFCMKVRRWSNMLMRLSPEHQLELHIKTPKQVENQRWYWNLFGFQIKHLTVECNDCKNKHIHPQKLLQTNSVSSEEDEWGTAIWQCSSNNRKETTVLQAFSECLLLHVLLAAREQGI